MKIVRLTRTRGWIRWSRDFWEGDEVSDRVYRDHLLPSQYNSIVGIYYDKNGDLYATWHKQHRDPCYARVGTSLQLAPPCFLEDD